MQEDVNLNEEWKTFDKGGRGKNQRNMNTYKGPDKNGNYLSYALYIRNKQPKLENIPPHSKFFKNDTTTSGGGDGEEESGEVVPERHVSRTLVESGFADQSSNSHATAVHLPDEYRIVLRKYRIIQTRRRIRNQLQKIDSYIKLRRQKLHFKENAPPDWRGIVLMVFGFIGLLLSILLGVFWDEEHYDSKPYYNGSHNAHKGHWGSGGGRGGGRASVGGKSTTSGPGARKVYPPPQALRPSEVYGGGEKKRPSSTASLDPYSRATPAQYEVSMSPNVPRSRSIKKSSSTTGAIGAAPNGATTTAAMATKAASITTASTSSSSTTLLTTRRRK
jgi:hypothetical protein